MTRPYSITPFDPLLWQTAHSDLVLDPDDYRQQLESKWTGVKFHEPADHCLLEWELPAAEAGAVINGNLLKGGQLVSLDLPHSDFFLWHRSVIASEYDLFLSTATSTKSLKLTTKTSEADIERFINII